MGPSTVLSTLALDVETEATGVVPDFETALDAVWTVLVIVTGSTDFEGTVDVLIEKTRRDVRHTCDDSRSRSSGWRVRIGLGSGRCSNVNPESGMTSKASLHCEAVWDTAAFEAALVVTAA
jgi:hypothetical protein